jgi:hypothetical protein
MEDGVSLIVCGHDATPQNLAATDLTHTYRCAASPDQVIATIKHDQRLDAQHLVLDFVRETIDNTLATTDGCARGVRPALG